MKFFLFAVLLFQIFGRSVFAQNDSAGSLSNESFTNLKGQLDGLNESYLETKSTVDKLSKVKVSGYIQAQWQLADSAGVPSMAGGNFGFNFLNWHNENLDKDHTQVVDSAGYLDTLATRQRFMVRRARVKTTYDAGTSKYVLEMDVLPTGFAIKDVNVTILEPWLKTFSATLGIMDRPFGFEVPYSSASLETPERTRMAQTLFPGEKDLGAKFEINPTEAMGFLQYLNFKGGFFTGMGGNNPNFTEVDNRVDFIGRGGFRAPIYPLNMELDGGVSAYLGSVADRSDYAITTKHGSKMMTLTTDSVLISDTLEVTTGNKGRLFDRNVYGVDAQFYCDIPMLGGLSLRGEYDWGKMPGTLMKNSPYYVAASSTDLVDYHVVLNSLMERKMAGWYLMLVQNIGKMFQATARYDVFDPNTDADGSDILSVNSIPQEVSPVAGKVNHLVSVADLKFSTLGFGLNYYWDEHLRFTAYYDMVVNEKVNAANADTLNDGTGNTLPSPNPLSHYRNDLSDNVFTFRAQFKF